MSPTKLPALWRRSAYAVAAAEDNDNSRSSNRGQILGLVPGLGAALENGWEIVIRVASSSKTDDFNRVNVRATLEFYARGTLVGAYACNNFSDAVNMAERFFGPHLPNCLIYTGSQDETRRDIEFTSAADLLAEEPPVLSWHVLDLLPAADVTLLFGDGGTGKSLAALQLAACTVARRPWLGLEPAGGPTVFISAEDGRDEIHRRLRMICAADHIEIAQLSDLRIRSMVGEDALLGIFNPDTRMIEPTAAYDAIERMVKDTQPTLLVLDTLADLFGGDENVRSQARQFIALLRRLTIPCGTTILCLAHPSVAGMNSGTGVSGSTGWSNSVRSRLYLERIKEWRGKGDNRKLVEPDVNARLLTTKKANYTKAGETIRIRWQDGVLKRHDVLAIEDKSVPRETAEEAAERVDAKFLDLLAAYTAEGRPAGPSPSSSYAPTLFAKDDRSAKITKAAFAKSMNRLLASGRIEIETYGSAARNAKRLAISTSDVPSEPSDPPSDDLQT